MISDFPFQFFFAAKLSLPGPNIFTYPFNLPFWGRFGKPFANNGYVEVSVMCGATLAKSPKQKSLT